MQKLNEVSVSRADLELALVYGDTTQAGHEALSRLRAAVDGPIEPVEPAAYLDLSKLDKGGMAYATGFRTGDAQTALFKQEGATITLGEKNLGCYGALYDGPSVRRAYTYKHQPGNQAAATLGNAWLNTQRGGDSIDAGLSLLKQLERAGYGVFAL